MRMLKPTARSRLSLLSLAAAVELAASAAGAQNVRVSLPAWREEILMDTLRQDHMLHASPEKVYAATLVAFNDLGIPAGNTDGKNGIIASERFERSLTLAGAPMARSFECGEGPTGQYANSFRLQIVIVAFVGAASDGGTKLGLAVIASGRDITGAYRVSKECASTGSLESKILDRVTKIVGG
jgi:hypothetical protein